VRPNKHWTKDPFLPVFEDDKLFGLGSNDAGASLVSLIYAYVELQKQELPFHLVLVASAEEENSGTNGIESVLPVLPEIYCGVVGEPTGMNAAIAERGLMVLDCLAKGKSGHAARNEGENAITNAIKDIQWFHNYQFPKISEWLGGVKMTVTLINAGSQHNVVPAECSFTVDVRIPETYTHEEILQTIKQHVSSEVKPRSLRMRSSSIAIDHPIVRAAKFCGKQLYGSPTSSDQALMPFATMKIGPGDSARSHTADEFIYCSEILNAISDYKRILIRFAEELNESHLKNTTELIEVK
jgi:acetylornithine deacetylase